jgi:hypothetical protein
MVDGFRRESYRGWLGAFIAAGILALSLSACGDKDVCRSGDSTPECSQEAGGIRFVTTCEASDPFGQQSCLTLSEGRTLDVLCGKASNSPDCTLHEDAHKTTGITEDTTGILLDQGSGALTLTVNAFDSGAFESDIPDFDTRESGLRIEILAASVGEGTATLNATLGPCADCPAPASFTVNPDYAWIQVARLPPHGPAGTLVLSGAGIEIADIRMKVATTRLSMSPALFGGAPSCGLR